MLVSDCSYLNIDDSVYSERDCSFLIAHLNIRSLPNKHNDLIDLMDVLNDKNMLPDILLLCETFLSEKNHSKFVLPNYDLLNEF